MVEGYPLTQFSPLSAVSGGVLPAPETAAVVAQDGGVKPSSRLQASFGEQDNWVDKVETNK